jgi:hypothetical protein
MEGDVAERGLPKLRLNCCRGRFSSPSDKCTRGLMSDKVRARKYQRQRDRRRVSDTLARAGRGRGSRRGLAHARIPRLDPGPSLSPSFSSTKPLLAAPLFFSFYRCDLGDPSSVRLQGPRERGRRHHPPATDSPFPRSLHTHARTRARTHRAYNLSPSLARRPLG